MIIKLFGLFDLLTAYCIIALYYNSISYNILIGIVLYLLFKGVMYKGDIASMIDIFIAVYIIFMILSFKSIILTIIIVGYILQKAYMSLK